MSESIVESVAVKLGIKPAQLKTADVQGQIPALKRRVDEYERQAIASEAAALENRAKAFSRETALADRAKFMRQATAEEQKAKTLAGFASTFIVQLGNFTALLTTMQIADDMKNVGLLNQKTSVSDWQKTMDSMQGEIDQLISSSNKLAEAMNIAFNQYGKDGLETEDTVDELEALFKSWEAEPDPIKKAEIQKKIEAKSKLSY